MTKVLRTLTTSAAIALGTACVALADDGVLPKDNAEFEKWGDESGWTIYVDKSRNACLIERVDENENVVQMGLTADKEFGYVGVFTKADVEFKDNKVHLRLDDKAYVGDATAAPSNLARDYKGGYLLANNPNFVDDLQKRYVMTVMPEDANTFDVSLDGTLKAIDKARECNSAVAG
ncbi:MULTISPECIES: hypothetical protein [Ruegeria]|uniref:Invasion protein B, involved in pathogenesis n=1 Tax=Ruegeria atlantica TaxID=81569 RepID=A0A0P1E2Y1_9RHOB|nr:MULTISPECIES: hypothetical protein [Ruegeria]CUH42618.1 hypothetical protein RUM4293_01506 [Ruegeria atlantica]